MNPSAIGTREVEPESSSGEHQRHRGFIAFCETNQRYEKGPKAWIFLGPYLLGALGLEILIDTGHAKTSASLGPWIGFLIYLVLFPVVWR